MSTKKNHDSINFKLILKLERHIKLIATSVPFAGNLGFQILNCVKDDVLKCLAWSGFRAPLVATLEANFCIFFIRFIWGFEPEIRKCNSGYRLYH